MWRLATLVRARYARVRARYALSIERLFRAEDSCLGTKTPHLCIYNHRPVLMLLLPPGGWLHGSFAFVDDVTKTLNTEGLSWKNNLPCAFVRHA